MSYDYDLIVIGTGPAGEACAMNAAKKGKRVAVVELPSQIGGNCTHKGTIPSKALRQAVKQILQFNNNPMFRSIGGPHNFSFPHILQHALKVIDEQVKMRSQFYGRNRVDVLVGQGSILDEHTVEIIGNHEVKDKYTTEKIVIATGSRPYHPPEVDFDHPHVYDSDKILKMNETPRTMIIYGAGVIGCEYASIFCGLGMKVDLINPGDRLLSFLDDEISDALSYHLRSNGVLIRHTEEFESIDLFDDHVVVHLKSGKRIKADAFMWCNGRSGNTEELGLENVGLEANRRGQLEVNEKYQTTVPSIYAIGDVIGWPSLASAAYDQGRSAAAEIISSDEFWFVNDVPNGIYTIPEISSVGKTERELTEEKVPYEVGQAMFKNTARAQITNEKVGMLKILFHRDTLELLGIHCFGAQAAEIVHIGQAIMNQKGAGNTIEYFTKTTFNYPTMAEAYRVAAINGLNRVF